MRPLAVVAALVVLTALVAAPSREPANAYPDHLTGTLGVSLSSPVLLVPDNGKEATVWLVFRREFDERAALSGINTGTRLTVRGKRGDGGQYRYLIVSEISKVD